MKFTPSNTYLAISKAAAYEMDWKVYYRITTTLSASLSESNFVEATNYIADMPSVSSKLEYTTGNYSADSITIKALDVDYWKTNVFTDTLMDDDDQFIEFKTTVKTKMGSLESEVVTPFYGFVNKESVSYEELSDTVTFGIYTPETVADKTPAYVLNTQYILNTGPLGYMLILPRIPGIYVVDANTGGLPLKTGLHKIIYDADTELVKLDDGREFATSASGFITLGDTSLDDFSIFGDTQQVQIYIQPEDLISVQNTVLEDYLIVTTEGDVLPRQPYYSFDLVDMLTKIYTEIGVAFTASDSFVVNAYDAGYRASFQNVPPDDVVGSIATCIVSDNTNYLLYGIGNKVYETTPTPTTYRLVASSSINQDDVIKKIMHRDSSDEFWVHYVNGGDNQVRKMTRVYNLGTLQYDYHISGSATWPVGETGHDNTIPTRASDIVYYNYTGSQYKNGVVYHADNAGLYYIDSNTYSGSCIALYTQTNYVSAQNVYMSGSTCIIGGLYDDGFAIQKMSNATQIDTSGNWNVIDTQKFVYRLTGQQIQYRPYDRWFHFFDTGSNEIIQVSASGYPGSELTIGQISGSYSLGTTFVNGGNTILSLNSKVAPDEGLFIFIDSNHAVSYVEAPSLKGPTFTHFPNTYFFINQSGILFKLLTESNMYIAPSFQYAELSLREYLNKLLAAYNLVGTINSNKQAKVYRRTDSAGNIVTSGNVLTLTKNDVIAVSINYENYKSSKVVELATANKSTNYNGTSFDVGYFSNTRKVDISSEVIPDPLYKDLAVHFYNFFNKDLSSVKVTTVTPIFQYEIFDSCNLQLADTKLALTGSGIIYGISHNSNGTSTLDILI